MPETQKTMEQLHDQVRALRRTLKRQRQDFEDLLHAGGIHDADGVADFHSSPPQIRQQARRELASLGIVIDDALWHALQSAPSSPEEAMLAAERPGQRLRRLNTPPPTRARTSI